MDATNSAADLQGDSPWTQAARKHWLSSSKPVTRVRPDALKAEFWDPLEKDNFSLGALHALESLRFLEAFLWPAFTDDSSDQHVILIAFMINLKRAKKTSAWDILDRRPAFSIFFRRLLALSLDTSLRWTVRTTVLLAIIGAFQSFEHEAVRKECIPLVAIGIWQNLHDDATRLHFIESQVFLKKAWKTSTKRFDTASQDEQTRLRFDRSWLYSLVLDFIGIVYDTSAPSGPSTMYCERVLEFISDLLSQFATRRYLNTLLKDINLLVLVRRSPLYADESNSLLRELYHLVEHYLLFPVDDFTLQQLSESQVAQLKAEKVAKLQRIAHKYFPEKLKLLALSNYAALEIREELASHLGGLTDAELEGLTNHLGYRSVYPSTLLVKTGRQFLQELVLEDFVARPSFQYIVSSIPILPTEQSLYEPGLLRNESYDGSRPVALPKLNLQYLSSGDFLWRSFILFKNEAFFEIRKDLEDTVNRLRPRLDFSTRQTTFVGSSRRACPIQRPGIVEVSPSRVGESAPAEVRVEVILNVSRMNDAVRLEWESLRPENVVFLLEVIAKGDAENASKDSKALRMVRTATIVQVLDEQSRPLRNQRDGMEGSMRRPRQRRLILKLDAESYKEDIKCKPEPYEGINLIIRRQSRENNFKAILDTIRSMALSGNSIPTWFQDCFLGLGGPTASSGRQLPSVYKSIDFRDTFLDVRHIRETYGPDRIHAQGGDKMSPPYILTEASARKEEENSAKRAKHGQSNDDEVSQTLKRNGGTSAIENNEQKQSSKKRNREMLEESHENLVEVTTYEPLNTGPYLSDKPKHNKVRFTPTQIQAIRSGVQPGLTVVVGPPGTGKTDVATQIISNLYHNFPQERILLIAHSNQALNQLFQKITTLNIDARHLLRLGHGEGELQTDGEASYGRHGRVESFLEMGTQYLAEVTRLASSIDAPGAHGSSCETADYFNQVYIKPAWTEYWTRVGTSATSMDEIRTTFPFQAFFSNAPQPIFVGKTKKALLDTARGCYRHLEKIFSELEDIRPFECLRNAKDRANYLLVKEARVIAMTTTHAAIHRNDIVKLGFRYDTVVMEEAAQVTEVETFIPLVLQPLNDGLNPLKRIILCGDHLQNSPIIQNVAFRQFANLEQSLFLRLIRLGVPAVMLDLQGRARPSLAELYSWRYPSLGSLDVISRSAEFTTANAGLRHVFQFIDVPDYKGRGENEPSPHYLQNLGEAEYAVALFMYMRLLGYAGSRISILTTYAGQRSLIRDVLAHRCKDNKLFGLPKIVSTVDRYQGEQNDYIILSLVRTSRVGYLRDMRRLTVALSRARLGLYIFGRRSVFDASLELQIAFERLFSRPSKLQLVVAETVPTLRGVDDNVESTDMEGVEHLGKYVFEMTKAKIEALKAGEETLAAEERDTGLDRLVAEDDDNEEVGYGTGSDADQSEEEEQVQTEDPTEFDTIFSL